MIEHKPRTGGRKKRPAPAEPLDPLEAAIAQYLEWIAVHGFSEDTVNTRRAYLGYFHDWCRERGLEAPIEITRPILERYQRWLYHYRKTACRNGMVLVEEAFDDNDNWDASRSSLRRLLRFLGLETDYFEPFTHGYFDRSQAST